MLGCFGASDKIRSYSEIAWLQAFLPTYTDPSISLAVMSFGLVLSSPSNSFCARSHSLA